MLVSSIGRRLGAMNMIGKVGIAAAAVAVLGGFFVGQGMADQSPLPSVGEPVTISPSATPTPSGDATTLRPRGDRSTDDRGGDDRGDDDNRGDDSADDSSGPGSGDDSRGRGRGRGRGGDDDDDVRTVGPSPSVVTSDDDDNSGPGGGGDDDGGDDD
jgi:hypothetical protein